MYIHLYSDYIKAASFDPCIQCTLFWNSSATPCPGILRTLRVPHVPLQACIQTYRQWVETKSNPLRYGYRALILRW